MKKHFERSMKERSNHHDWSYQHCRPTNDKNFDLEDLPNKEGIRDCWLRGYRGSNIHFAPLLKFLESRVGKHWNDVYSEIKASFKDEQLIKFAKNCVEFNVEEREDGEIYYSQNGRWRSDRPLRSSFRQKHLLLDAQTGVLSVAPKETKRKRESEITLITFPSNPLLQYRLITKYGNPLNAKKREDKRIWYALFLAKKPEMVKRVYPQSVFVNNCWVVVGYKEELVLPCKDIYCNDLSPTTSFRLYGSENLYCCGMQTLNTKELEIVRRTIGNK